MRWFRNISRITTSERFGLKLFIIVPILFCFLLFPNTTNAQSKSIAGIPDVLNVEGLISCVGVSFASNLLHTTCGNRFTSSGSFDIGDSTTGNKVPYVTGDTAKCTWTRLTTSATCVVSHQDGTASLYSTSAGTSALTTVQLDANGKPIGTPEEQSALVAAGSTVVGTVSDIAAVVTGAGECLLSGPVDCLVTTIGSVILGFSTILLGMAGVLFNLVVVKAVFGFSTLVGNSPGLLIAWGILRDIGNMLLLFGFIFMGLATILDLHTYHAKKALPNLIIFAILMNFSLFVSEAIIDVSNGLASVIYTQSSTACPDLDGSLSGAATGSEAEYQKARESYSSCAVNYGIGGSIMEVSGLSTMFTIRDEQAIQSIVVYLGLSLFAIIGAVVMFAAAIMLIVRTVTLTFLIIFSPIGFAGMAIPPLHEQAKKWWSTLINQALFAPVLILLMLVSLKVSASFAGGGENDSLAAALMSPSADVMVVVFVFMLVIGLLIASLIAAKNFGAIGAGFAINLGTRVAFGGVTRGTNLLYNGSAMLARKGTARGVASLQGSRFAQRNMVTRGITTGVTRSAQVLTNSVLKPAEKANLDLRRIPGVGKALTKAGAGAAAQPLANGTLGDMSKQLKEAREHIEHEGHEFDENIAFTRMMQKIRTGQSLTPEEQRLLSSQSTQQLEEMAGIRQGIDTLVQELSPEQFENLLKSDKLSAGEKDNIKRGRYNALGAAASSGSVSYTRSITKNMEKSELENLPPELLANQTLLDALSDKQRDDLSGSKKRTSQEREMLRKIGPVFVTQSAFDTGGVAAAIATHGGRGLGQLTPAQVAKLPNDLLVNQGVVPQLTTAMLTKLQEGDKLKSHEMQAIGDNIRNPQSGASDKLRAFVTGGPGAAIW